MARPTRDDRLVLVVEDDDDSAALLVSYLERLGCAWIHAASAEEALRILTTARADLVIVDLLLPDMDGWELITVLRSITTINRRPIVVCSVLDQQDYPKDIDGVLPKPYTRRQVSEVVLGVLSRSERP